MVGERAAETERDFDALTCMSCGRALDGDPDEDPIGNAGEPICGECVREANFFDLEIADGELDNQIDD